MRHDTYQPEDELAGFEMPIHRSLTTPRMWFGTEKVWAGLSLLISLLIVRATDMQPIGWALSIGWFVSMHLVLRAVGERDPYRVRNYLRSVLRPSHMTGRALRRGRLTRRVRKPTFRPKEWV